MLGIILGPPSNQVSCTPKAPTTTYVFYTETNGNTVRRIDFTDGGNETEIASLGTAVNGIGIDRANGHIYVALPSAGKIVRMGLDGSNQEDWKTGLTSPQPIHVHEERVYWGDGIEDAIYSDTYAKDDPQTNV